jgi:hypothetical protein
VTQNKTEIWVPVAAFAECKRCHAKHLAWQQGKSGKWYLAAARKRADGKLEANRRQFHECPNTSINANGVKVSDFDVPF